MKRHPSLAPLSRDHHHVLVLAQGLHPEGPQTLRDALPADPAERARHTLEVWRREIEPHFESEERFLAPALEGRDPALDAELARMRRDHEGIRALVAAVDPVSPDVREALADLGRALVAHVRAEERGLFEVAQRVMTEPALAAALQDAAWLGPA